MKRSDKQAAKKNGMPSTVARRCQKDGIEAKDGPNHGRTTKNAASASGEAKAEKAKRRQTPEEERKAAIEKILEEIPSAPPTVGLRKICEDAGVKCPTFLLWVSQDEKLAERYARALEYRTEADVDRINEISMAPAVTVSTEFSDHVDSGDVQLRRLQVDTLKWLAAKRMPKKYGDRVNLDHDGKVGFSFSVDLT